MIEAIKICRLDFFFQSRGGHRNSIWVRGAGGGVKEAGKYLFSGGVLWCELYTFSLDSLGDTKTLLLSLVFQF